jgi:predicted amidophosphoribosyltransferase
MFRCMTILKGLIIDIDSFPNEELSNWKDLVEKYQCLFITSSEQIANSLSTLFESNVVYKLEKFLKLFSPSRATHEEALRRLNLLTSEVAYVSANYTFITYALQFLSGTVLISENVSYEQASICPDMICDSIKDFEKSLEKDFTGFFGETVLYPGSLNQGFFLPVDIENDGDEDISLFMLGRYFGYSHYMSQLHPYSSAIYLNKKEGSKVYGTLNRNFASLYSIAIKNIAKRVNIDCICNVPTRPGKNDRFKEIVTVIANKCNLTDISANFKCKIDYPTQKGLSESERQNNVKDVFEYTGTLKGKTVVLIDDIVTTGATIKACVNILKKSGAEKVLVVALAINQKQGNYWSFLEPSISCPNCGSKMKLLINSINHGYFYSCFECKGKSISFEAARQQLIDNVNFEFDRTHD